MRVLFINKFFFRNGGAEACLFDTAALLKRYGHSVAYLSMRHPRNLDSTDPAYFVSQVDYEDTRGVSAKIKAAAGMLYSREAYAVMERAFTREKPDVVHLQNIYHQLSPSVLAPLRTCRTPIIMTLHDYKMVCPVYTLFRAGHPCERCRDKRFFWCVLGRCSKGSFVKSALVSLEMTLHHLLSDAYDRVDTFIAPSRFLADTVTRMGFRKRVVVLPNFVDVTGILPSPVRKKDLVVYFGRLTIEKGVHILLEAMRGLPLRCEIIGDGPERQSLEIVAQELSLKNVRFLGHLDVKEALARVGRANVVVVPSLWYENNPRAILEAFALGKPVVGSHIGGIPELVVNGVTGGTVPPGDPEALAQVLLSLSRNGDTVRKMGEQARQYVEQLHSPQAYYRELMTIYAQAAETR